jgi:MOSC domain-containing protein YiiM
MSGDTVPMSGVMSGVKSVQALLDAFPRAGRLEWIGLRSARRGEVKSAAQAEAIAGLGLAGDHRTARKRPDPQAKRQVTLLQAEHLPVVARFVGRDAVDPAELRRNLVVSGVNLQALKDRRFRIGEVLLEGTGYCHPCSRMEEALGAGGLNAMRGHGGLTARILEGGVIRVGDAVVPERQA